MLRALFLALAQLADPAIRRLLWRAVVLALLTLVALAVAIPVLVNLVEATRIGWLDGTLAVAGGAVGVVLAWLLFPVAVAATLGWYAETVIEAVERRHYPELPPASGAGFAASTAGAIRFAAVALLLNLLALPLYLAAPGANVLVYFALNGYLLGREYLELVAGRRLPWPEVLALRRRERGRVWAAGVVIAGMLTVPLFNLIAPVVAIAFMVHRFERLQRRGSTARDGPRADRRRTAPIGDGSV
jgi:CysZ protein